MARKDNKHTIIRDINIIDILIIDHRFLKDCYEVLISDQIGKHQKLEVAKDFFIDLQKHFESEQEIVYSPLKADEEFHFNILESEVEHGIVDDKIKKIFPELKRAKVLSDEMEAELKVLAELVKNHIKEEESELLPKMNEYINEESLKKMGQKFMVHRGMSISDFENYPHLPDELVSWKDDVQKISSQFLAKMDKYVENLKH